MSVQTIDSYWDEQAWGKYKLCRQNLVKHTGGGDGDEDWYGESVSAVEDSDDGSSGEDSDNQGVPKTRKRLVLQGNVTGRYTRKTLLRFLQSDIFTAIHQRYGSPFLEDYGVADVSVVHTRTAVSSANVHSTRRPLSLIPSRRRTACASV